MGPPENKSTPWSEWVWAAKYCQSANNSIKLVINHIWAISFSFFDPTRNRVVCYTAVFSVVTQWSSPQACGEERCVTTLKTAV